MRACYLAIHRRPEWLLFDGAVSGRGSGFGAIKLGLQSMGTDDDRPRSGRWRVLMFWPKDEDDKRRPLTGSSGMKEGDEDVSNSKVEERLREKDPRERE